MKCCQPHWNAMRSAIEERGMSGLVAQNGKDASDAAVRELNGVPTTPQDFDPLMAMNWNFFSAALEHGGLYLMGLDENGNPYCPLCEANKNSEDGKLAEDWISGCADAMLEHAREIGVMPKVQ